MKDDTIIYDSLTARPLPKWLTDQREGLNTAQPPKIIIKEDNSLSISMAATGIFVFLVVSIISIYIIRKYKNNTI